MLSLQYVAVLSQFDGRDAIIGQCPLVGAYYEGTQNIVTQTATSYQECQNQCVANAECNSWVWRTGFHQQNDTCVLRRGITGNVIRDVEFPTGGAPHISCASKTCADPTDPTSECLLHGAFFSSPDLLRSVANVFSTAVCEAQCAGNPQCQAWTWRSSRHPILPNSCQLHRFIDGTVDFGGDNNFPEGPLVHYSCGVRDCRVALGQQAE